MFVFSLPLKMKLEKQLCLSHECVFVDFFFRKSDPRVTIMSGDLNLEAKQTKDPKNRQNTKSNGFKYKRRVTERNQKYTRYYLHPYRPIQKRHGMR